MSSDMFLGYCIAERTADNEISIKKKCFNNSIKDDLPIQDFLDFFNKSLPKELPKKWIDSIYCQYSLDLTSYFIATQKENLEIECIIIVSKTIDETEQCDEEHMHLIGKKLILQYIAGNDNLNDTYTNLINDLMLCHHSSFHRMPFDDAIFDDIQFLSALLTSHFETGMRTLIVTDSNENYVRVINFLSNFVYDNLIKHCTNIMNSSPNEFQLVQPIKYITENNIKDLFYDYTIVLPEKKEIFTSKRKAVNASPWATYVVKNLKDAKPEKRPIIAEQKLCEIMRASIGFIGIADEKIRTSGSEKLSEKQLIEISKAIGMSNIEDIHLAIGVARLHKDTVFTKILAKINDFS